MQDDRQGHEGRSQGTIEPSSPPEAAALEVRGISKRFGEIQANDGVDLTLRSGEIHAILGENGAGKAVLMKLLYGVYVPDERNDPVRRPARRRSTRRPRRGRSASGWSSRTSGSIPALTVLENVALALPERGFRLRAPGRRPADR